MILKDIHISHFRNLENVLLRLPERGLCVISGPNGSGKTSLLEAIYAITCGKSFRTSDPSQLIQNQQDSFTLFASLFSEDHQVMPIGVQRDRKQRIIVKCMGEATKLSEIAALLPIRLISPLEAYTLINGGPEYRRRFLDWGVFHVKHSYWALYKKLIRIIKQKNAALKMRCTDAELIQWNYMLCEVSYALDEMRQEYVKQLRDILAKYQARLLNINHIEFQYFPGWDKESSDLSTQLSTVLKQERQQGHCLIGPHRADLLFYTTFGSSKDQLSRGRQKMLAIALYLAQGELLFREKNQHPLYLIDDFSSELDVDTQKLLIDSLSLENKQVVITSLEEKNSVLEHIFNKNQRLTRYSISKGALSVFEGTDR